MQQLLYHSSYSFFSFQCSNPSLEGGGDVFDTANFIQPPISKELALSFRCHDKYTQPCQKEDGESENTFPGIVVKQCCLS